MYLAKKLGTFLLKQLKLTLLCVSILCIPLSLVAQFTHIDAGLTGVESGAVAWGDYDNDGDLDILLTGAINSTGNCISKIYCNNGNSTFTSLNAGLTNVDLSAVAWGDLDNDGDLDIILTGNTSSSSVTRITKIYRNNGNSTFTSITTGLISIYCGSVACGDYDNDGDLDILLSGGASTGYISRIYRNDGNFIFTDINAGLPGVSGSVAWGDYDNDGDLDILLTGSSNLGNISRIYRNDGNSTFTDIIAGLPGVYASSVAWGDYDNDGDIDILLTGSTGNEFISKIYHNNGNSTFSAINAGLTGIISGSAAWGDYDNDGDLDVLLSGYSSSRISRIYRNDGNSVFTNISAGLIGVDGCSVAWGDYDNDKDLDFLLSGNWSGDYISYIYRNNINSLNSVPSAPSNLRKSVIGTNLILQWNASSDIQTPSAGLNYVLRIGTASGSYNISSPMANLTTGYRRIPIIGYANSICKWKIDRNSLIQGTTYYWSVQAIDTALGGSSFSAEATFNGNMVYYSISGNILDYQNVGIEGVIITASDVGSCQSQSDGSFQISVPENWNGICSASKTGWVFSPSSKSYSNVCATTTDQNFRGKLAPPIFSVAGGNYSTAQSITLSSLAQGIIKYKYSLLYITPTYYSGTNFWFPINISHNSTIQAIAYIEGQPGTVSDKATASYNIGTGQNDPLNLTVIDSRNQAYSVELTIDKPGLYLNSHINKDIGSSGKVSFIIDDFTNQSHFDSSNLTRISILNEAGIEIGHMKINDLPISKIVTSTINAIIVVHSEHTPFDSPTGYPWQYYAYNERMVSMIIKPPVIRNSKVPLLLVHGIGDSYPHFGENWLSQLQTAKDFDIWQFYYPYDQQIELSAGLLRDALARIQVNNYTLNNGRINILAYSMGGLVTRTYIQSPNYQNNINKLLMLGTPNHGSHSTYRLNKTGYPLTEIANDFLIHQDQNSPAVKEMVPNSYFINGLNASPPRPLFPGANNQNTYLVLAGNLNESKFMPLTSVGEVYYPENSDDAVVSVSSASLLEFNIPLAIYSCNHKALVGNPIPLIHITSVIYPGQHIAPFFDNSYNPMTSSFKNSFNRFLTHVPNEMNCAGNFYATFNTLLNSKVIPVELGNHNGQLILDLNFGITETIIHKITNHSKSMDDLLDSQGASLLSANSQIIDSNYFLEVTNIFNEPLAYVKKGLGSNFNSGSYLFRLKKLGSTFKTVRSPVNFGSYCTNNVYFNLVPGEQAIARLNNGLPQPTRTCFREQGRTIREEQYYVDSSMDSLVFYLGSEDNPIFASHGAYLLAPDNTIIDTLYAFNSPDVDFSQDIEAGFAYYYVRNPMAGLWKLRYNDALPDSVSATYIDSPISISVTIPDSSYAIRERVDVKLPLPKPITYTQPQFMVGLSYVDSTGVNHIIGNITSTNNPADSSYSCFFIPVNPGSYRINVDFQCQLGTETVRRHLESFVNVQEIQIPQLLTPSDGTANLLNPVTLTWKSTPSASSYYLEIYSWADSLPAVSISVTDTTYSVNNLLPGSKYYWLVRSVSPYGTSQSSSINHFYTKINSPVLLSPTHNSLDMPKVVDLNWEAARGATYYHFQLSESPTFSFCTISDSLCSENSYQINDLSNTQTYYWRVAAINEYGKSEWSQVFSFTIRRYTISFPANMQSNEDNILSLYLPRYIDDFDPNNTQVSISGNVHLIPTYLTDSINLTPNENWSGHEDLILTISSASRTQNSHAEQMVKGQNDRNTIIDTISVDILPVNDLPTMSFQNTLVFWDNESTVIDFTPFLGDIDNAVSEISVTAVGSTHLGIRVRGRVIRIIREDGWYGNEPITINLSNSLRGSSKNINDCSSYNINVFFINSQPVIFAFTIANNMMTLKWNLIKDATSYRVLSSSIYSDNFTDITDTGTIYFHKNEIMWQSAATNQERSFYQVQAIKNQLRNTGAGNSLTKDLFER